MKSLLIIGVVLLAWWYLTRPGAASTPGQLIGGGVGSDPKQRGTEKPWDKTSAGRAESWGLKGVHDYNTPTFPGFGGVPVGGGRVGIAGTGLFSYGSFLGSNPLDASIQNPGLTPNSIQPVVRRK